MCGGGSFLSPIKQGDPSLSQHLLEGNPGLHTGILISGEAPMAAASGCILASPSSSLPQLPVRPIPRGAHCLSPSFSSAPYAVNFVNSYILRYQPKRRFSKTIQNVSTVAVPSVEETKECSLPTWAQFELGRAPVFWKTMNGLPPTSGETLTLFYNPGANNLVPNDEFGIGFNGGFNQPIMCGGEPRVMTRKKRGKADPPIYTIKICVPKHAVSLIFSFTNGEDWDGPYKLRFQVLKMWRNKPMDFFNEGLAAELSKEGACDRAIFPDSHVVISSCAIGSLYAEGGDRCNLDFMPGCMDPNSPLFDPLANVDDGSCPLDSESDSEEQ